MKCFSLLSARIVRSFGIDSFGCPTFFFTLSLVFASTPIVTKHHTVTRPKKLSFQKYHICWPASTSLRYHIWLNRAFPMKLFLQTWMKTEFKREQCARKINSVSLPHSHFCQFASCRPCFNPASYVRTIDPFLFTSSRF